VARFTQYIGLSQRAWEFLKNHNYKEIYSYEMTEGIAQEPVMGSLYECTIPVQGRWSCLGNEYMEYAKALYIEEVQVEPWSSGPMIFTQLKNILTGKIVGEWTDEEINAVP
jgi:hypothetical protein